MLNSFLSESMLNSLVVIVSNKKLTPMIIFSSIFPLISYQYVHIIFHTTQNNVNRKQCHSITRITA